MPLPLADHDPRLFEQFEWRIDADLPRRAADRHSWTHSAYASLQLSQRTCTHVAKFLPCDATDEQWRHFQRQAYVAWHFFGSSSQAFHCRLSQDSPVILYPRLEGLRLEDWSHQQSQCVARTTWVGMALELLIHLRRLHQLGYVHGQVRPEHVWLDGDGHVHLLGLGSCEPVGERFPKRVAFDRFDPPELQCGSNEATSAQDIFSAAAVIDSISVGRLANSPVGKCMQAANPYDRPTASELVELLVSYRRELDGNYGLFQARAA